MVYPPYCGIQPNPPCDRRRLIHQHPPPAGSIYPVSSAMVYLRPQDVVGGMYHRFPAAPAYYPGTTQHYSVSSQLFYPHYPFFDTGPTSQHRAIQRAHEPSVYSMPPGSDSLNSRAGDKRPHIAGQTFGKTIVDGSRPTTLDQSCSGSLGPQNLAHPVSTISSTSHRSKPLRHALWAGNIPQSANLLELKDHFSRDATEDIESVFLISRSNCAFVNYRSSAACAAALSRHHGLDFQGRRLVCKLQEGSIESETEGRSQLALSCSPDEASSDSNNGSMSTDRYFVMKSLTKEELETSRQNGIWLTQTHNEFKLKQALKSSRQVYLIFSANRSGEYFGYARMLSPIDENETSIKLPRLKPRDGRKDVLNVIPTDATSVAPKGRLITDLARNTMFWEADCLECKSTGGGVNVGVRGTEARPFGRPFRIQWLSFEPVPFHRAHELRNPWNFGRHVKIARDGTEIEPTVGRKLVQLFHDK